VEQDHRGVKRITGLDHGVGHPRPFESSPLLSVED
jgi:hypothetical protein